jgi:AcrR family transcriptional regulator
MVTPPTDRRERKRQRLASHLSATAFELFEVEGYDKVTMEQIADEADVAKATLYNYFPVKEALLAHRFQEDIAAGMTARASALTAHKTFDARMRYLLRESAAWHTERKVYLPHYLRFLTNRVHASGKPPLEKDQGSDAREILTLMFRAGQAAGEVGTTQTAAQIAWSFEYLLFGAVSAWLSDPSKSLTERFLAAFDLVMHGVASTKDANSSKPQRARRKS